MHAVRVVLNPDLTSNVFYMVFTIDPKGTEPRERDKCIHDLFLGIPVVFPGTVYRNRQKLKTSLRSRG
jgi:hypothetical protein